MKPQVFFEDFLSIPRESGNETRISEYLENFAIKYNLEYYRDKYNNVIIKKKSNSGSAETIALQGHIDMVCTSNNNYDFKNKGIDWYIEDGFYKARGTTLGADNGVGCAIILSILADNKNKMPNIEAIFTTSEETNMNGAKRLDYSKITTNKFISLDGTDEGVIDVSSAGMYCINLEKNIEFEENNMPVYKIKVSGLKGGHSGIDIDKNHGNAIEIVINLLSQLNDFKIISLNGGSKYNVIPNFCECIFASNEKIDFYTDFVSCFDGANIELKKIDKSFKSINKEESDEIFKVLHTLPKGVLSYKDSYPQTSLNLAIVETSFEHISLKISVRSSNKSDEKSLIEKIKALSLNMDFKIIDYAPFFEYKENSLLRELLANKYHELFNKNVIFNHVHAGLEGGVFSEKIDDIDICVISPNLYSIHTIDEKVEIESINRVHMWLLETLKAI